MLSDASVEKQWQLCAQDISETYDEERLEEFVKESRQTPSRDDWAGKMGEDKARMQVYLQTVNLLRTDPWLGIQGAVYHGRHYAVDQEIRKYSASLVFDASA